MKKYRLTENQYKLFKTFLKEDAESDSQKKAIQYLMNKEGMTKEEADKFVRKTFREKFTILNNNRKVGKFTLGALRIYFEDCKSETDCRKLYTILQAISDNNEIAKGYDRNFNGKHLNELLKEIKPKSENKTPKNNKKVNKTDYTIHKIESFQQAEKFSPYVSWCITKDEYHFNNYSNKGRDVFYFVVKNDYENMNQDEYKDEKLLGEYGLSMLAICVNPNGSLKSCTCRWNHDKGGNDRCLNIEQIEKVTNLDFSTSFPPNKEAKELIKTIDEVEKLLKDGDEIEIEFKSNKLIIELRDRFPNIDFKVTREYSGCHTLSVAKCFNYMFNNKNEFIAKTYDERDSYIFLNNILIYENIKTNSFVKLDIKENTKTTLKGVNSIQKFLVNENEGIYAVMLNRNNSSILYDDEFNEVIDIYNLPDFKNLDRIYEYVCEYGVSIGYVIVKYIDKNGNNRITTIQTQDKQIFQDVNIEKSINNLTVFKRLKKDAKCRYLVKVIEDLYENAINYELLQMKNNGLLMVNYIDENGESKYAIYVIDDCDECIVEDTLTTEGISLKYGNKSKDDANIEWYAWSDDGDSYHLVTPEDEYENVEIYPNIDSLNTKYNAQVSLVIKDENDDITLLDYNYLPIDMDEVEKNYNDVEEYGDDIENPHLHISHQRMKLYNKIRKIW